MNRAWRRAAAAAGVGLALALAAAGWLRLRDGHGDALDRLASSLSLKAGDSLRFEWQNHAQKHWQIRAQEPVEAAEVTDAREGTRGACAVGMVEVAGEFLLDAAGQATSDQVESLQSKTCSSWIDKEFPARCADFDPDEWAKVRATLPRKSMHFCIDRFEYPNQRGAYPWIVATYTEAARLCKGEGKRLCSETEWTFACEGEDADPYPGTHERAAADCVTDRSWREFDASALGRRASARAESEVDRLWQGEASGSRASCRSSFGVHDLTGNVDEWTTSVRRTGYRSVLKGGYWGPVRSRCRPATRAHDENFVAYQQGFRCCGEPLNEPPREPPSDAGADGGAPPEELEDVDVEPAPALELLDEDEAISRKERGASRGCGPLF